MEKDLVAREKKRTEKAVCRRLKSIEHSLEIKHCELAECANKQEYENKGNLLSCFFNKLHMGMDKVIVENLFDNGSLIEITLHKKKSPQKNIASYFAQVKKLERREKVLPEIISILEQEKLRWKNVLEKVETATTMEDVILVQKENKLLERPSVKKKTQKEPFRTFYSKNQIAILVGRDAHSNDILTFQRASGDDVWLHAHGCPGSHVVIRLGDKELDRDTLVDAMLLALYYSKRRSLPHAKHEVVYCKRRHVSKRKGAPAGEVMVAGGTLERVLLDSDRVACLQKTQKVTNNL